jgi:DNA-binding response OmpR family regulator
MARCLLVEDDCYYSTLMQDILINAAKANNRYTRELIFDVVTDVGKALSMIAINHYDLLITDLYFARMDGYEMIKKIRENITDKDLPIIVVSAIADIDVKYPNLRAGATDIFEKPLRGGDLQRFVTVVFNLIAGR